MKKTFYLLTMFILASACNNNSTTSEDPPNQAETVAISDTISSTETEKTDTLDTYEKLKESDRQIMQDILKNRKTLQ